MELNKYDWHHRTVGCDKQAACPVCGCPAAGTMQTGRSHRAVLESEGFPFPFIVRKVTSKGPQQVRRSTPWPRSGRYRTSYRCRDVDTARNPDLPKRAPVLDSNNPGDTTLNLLARAAMFYVMGDPLPRIDQKMKLKRRTVNTWKSQWPEHWEHLPAPEIQIAKMVKAQIGTAGIRRRGGPPPGREPSSGRRGGFRFPNRASPPFARSLKATSCRRAFTTTKPRTIYTYRGAVNSWRLITGDPPIESITAETMALFRMLSQCCGKNGPYMKAATNTVAAPGCDSFKRFSTRPARRPAATETPRG